MKKIGNSSVWFEKYKPSTVEDLILPTDLKDKLLKQTSSQKIPHMLLCSNVGGCLLPGTNIHVFKEPNFMTIKDLSKTLKVSEKRIKYVLCNYDNMYDLNEITPEIMIVLKDKTKKSLICMNNDSKYTDKHLKLSHWLTKIPLDEAIKKTNTLRKYKMFFDYNSTDSYWDNWKKEDLFNIVQKIKFNLIYSEFEDLLKLYNMSHSILTESFWKFRGYSDSEITDIISNIQRKRSVICKEYWEKQDYEESQYKEIISNVQH